MDQEDVLDFEALRAKFQDKELLLKQPKFKPALPEKPKVVPPPQSPPHHIPAGARPSLLTSISQSLEGKTAVAPRVVFKDAKKESRKSLIQVDKSEGKLKKSKDKATSASKEKLDEDPSDQKPKKENGKDKKFPLVLPLAPKESAAELVPAMPPPKAPTAAKKGFLGFKKSSKRDSLHVSAPILDAPSSGDPGPAPLIPVPTNFGDAPPEPEISRPKALLPNIPTLPDSSAAVEITPPPTIPASPDFNPPPAFIPDIPAPADPTPESETPPVIETPSLPVSRPVSQIEIIQSPPSVLSTPPPSCAITGPPPVPSSPSPAPPEPDVGIEAVDIANIETPPPPVIDAPSIPPSPKAERPISALSALERAEDMSPGKRTPTCDQRIFNALEKARRKTNSPQISSTTSYSITPPPEELPPSQSPTTSLPDLPPIDYEDRAGKPAQVNGFDHRQASPVLEGIAEERPDPIPELLVLPPPPPRKVHTDPQSLNPAPEKPHRPLSVNPSDFIPPPLLENNESEFSETDTMNVPEFDNLASDAHSPELPVSEWGNEGYTGPDTPDGQNLREFYSNGINTPGADAEPAYGDEVPALPESSFPISQENPPQAGLQVNNGDYESTDNVYETINTSNGKKKSGGGKKRKGPPKNPYAEAPPETSEEKSKTGRFGKSDKKAAAEGPDEKELKKKEKQRLEKEKKELKEKQEREKKEQKEREKKENELKKKFKITGHEDAMYEAKVTVTTKGRKDDLPVKSGDIISIIRTTNCPKGKWLARDSSNNYGYVAVDHVELDIKEMLELGKKAATTHKSGSNAVEAEVISTGSRASNHYPLSAESFTDDSEEWTCDDDEPLSPAPENPLVPVTHARTVSMPEMGMQDVSVNHQHSHSDISADGPYVQARHEALQKLATFFHSPKPVEPEPSSTEPETSPVIVNEESVQLPNSAQEMDFDLSDMLILPPPDLYADKAME